MVTSGFVSAGAAVGLPPKKLLMSGIVEQTALTRSA